MKACTPNRNAGAADAAHFHFDYPAGDGEAESALGAQGAMRNRKVNSLTSGAAPRRLKYTLVSVARPINTSATNAGAANAADVHFDDPTGDREG